MPNYRTPGVYFEWLDSRSGAIVPLRTDIAGFVGIAERGPLHRPVKIESWTQFVSAFGQHIPQAYLAYAVEGFFANGGRTCWVVRVADPAAAHPAWCDIVDANNRIVLRLTAATGFVVKQPAGDLPYDSEQARKLLVADRADPGVWGRNIRVLVIAVGRTRFSLDLSLPSGAREFWRDLSLNSEDERYVEKLLNDPLAGSQLVTAKRQWPSDQTDPPRVGTTYLQSGQDGLERLRVEHFAGTRGAGASTGRWGLAALELIDEVSIVAMPDIMPKPPVETRHPGKPKQTCDIPEKPPDQPHQKPPALAIDNVREWPTLFDATEVEQLQRELITHCELLKDRVALLDPRYEDIAQADVLEWRTKFDTKYAGLYYPWLMVPDPLRLEGLLRAVPPCGHIAGVYARVDWRVGVHKPPANEQLEGVLDLATSFFDQRRAGMLSLQRGRATSEALPEIAEIVHGDLNERQVNLIRACPGRGLRVMGARTLSSDTLWRYINVRRLLIMIEEAIDEQTQSTVFEPATPDLWREIERIVRGFLNGLWRRGMLDGNSAEEAYNVVCDATTNPSDQTERGRMICQVGVLPPWPAEFVIVRIGKTENRVEILEERGG